MSTTVSTAPKRGSDFKVKDLSLAEWGRKEIEVAQAKRRQFASDEEVETAFRRFAP